MMLVENFLSLSNRLRRYPASFFIPVSPAPAGVFYGRSANRAIDPRGETFRSGTRQKRFPP